MIEVAILFGNDVPAFMVGTDCAVAEVENMTDATEFAMDMYKFGHCAELRIDGVVTNRWLGTQWANSIQTKE